MVSMGDSYSSGEGITPFYGQNLNIWEKTQNEDWLAHRSTESWPGQLRINGLEKEMKNYKVELTKKENTKDNLGKWYFVAVSGAETKHMSGEMQEKTYHKHVTVGEKPKGSKLYENNTCEGTHYLLEQNKIFNDLTKDEVDYVTLTLGGNDVGFADIVKECVVNIGFSEPNDLRNRLNYAWEIFNYGED